MGMTNQEFKGEMGRLAVAFGQEPNVPQWLVYWDRLQRTGYATFREAVTRIIDTERFFPTVATMHGYCDRVRTEAATKAADDPANAPRLKPGTRLPICASCNDAGWIAVENRLPNMPNKLEKCLDCGGAVKGADPLFHSRQADAYAYHLDREHARYPAVNGDATIGTDLRAAVAGVAAGLRMDREGARPVRHARDDEEGAHSRWTPPMPKAGAA